jgi:hypothetical protein
MAGGPLEVARGLDWAFGVGALRFDDGDGRGAVGGGDLY